MNMLHKYSRIAGLTAIVAAISVLALSCGGGGGGGTTTPEPTPTATFQGAVSIRTTLSGGQEVPAVTTAGAGTAVFTVKPGTGDLVGSVTFSGLSGNATAAHIHLGAAGSNGPVAIALTGGEGVPAGTFTVPAGTALVAAQLTSLYAGELYVNIHTANNPGGEIRGQILFPTATIGATALSGAEVVPPVTTTGNGTGTMTVNLGTGRITGGSIVFSGLSSNATLAHIHQGAAGTNGPVVVNMLGGAGATSGTWNIQAGETLSADALNALINDELYFAVHSANNPAGELRGQIRYRITLTPSLSGDQEVPAVATTGSGSANLSLNPATGALTGSVSFSGLSSNATAAHIHQGAAGVNGGVLIPLTGGGATSGTFDVPTGTVLTMDQLTLLKGDGLYINIHTVNNGGGEIRGQIVSP